MAPKRKTRAAAEQQDAGDGPSTSGEAQQSKVVYIGHIPHGFFEEQLKDYFSQFGKVTKVRVARSKKTARSKHYAFLEFASAEVARIAAEAMDGYLFFKQKLVARIVPPEEVHPDTFKGANRVFKKMPWQKIERERHNRVRAPGEEAARTRAAVKRDKQRKEKISEAGIDYEYPGLEALLPKKAQKTTFD